MKRLSKTLPAILLTIGSLWLSFNSYAALSGAYTVDTSLAASSTNYKNLSSVISDLISGSRTDGGTANGSGVSGAVTITLGDIFYKNQINLSAIKGASSTNTITFKSNGGDSSKCMLVWPSSTSTANDYVLQLNGADYIRFEHIGFHRTGTAANATVCTMLSGATYNIFRGCLFYGNHIPSNSTTGFASGPSSCIYSTGNDSMNQFIGNHLVNGYNGFYFSATTTGNQILNNLIDSSGSSGFYATNQNGVNISGNIMNITPFSTAPYTSYGIRLETSAGFNISNNKISITSNATVCRAIVLFNNNSGSTTEGRVVNNFLIVTDGSSSSTGLALGGNTNLKAVYNNILVSSKLTTGAAMFIYGPPQSAGSGNNLWNNNFINSGSGYAFSAPGTTSNIGAIDTSDYNNLYVSGTYLANESSSNYTTLSAWRTAVSLEANGINANPGFYSSKDLHVTNIALNGKGTPISFVTTDIDGDVRSTSTPDIGADEFTPASNDAGISSIDSPSFFCSGTQNVVVKLNNYGTSTLTSASIEWSINGTSKTTYSWSGSLASGASTTVNLGSFSPTTNTIYYIKAWTKSPNGSTDGLNNNDTSGTNKASALNGTYTIGGSSPDFSSFNDAVSNLTFRGVCGAVTFNIADGTYNESISIPLINGTSKTNTITWQSTSKDSSKVILSQASTNINGNNNAAIQLNGGKYNTFRQLTFQRTGTALYSNVLEIKNHSSVNNFLNCRFIGEKMTGAYSALVSTYDVIVSPYDRDDSLHFMNNYIKYGNRGINFYGDTTNPERGTVISNNIFDSTMYQLINLNYQVSPMITFNTNNKSGFVYQYPSGIVLDYCDSALRVTNNNLQFYNGATDGIYLNNSSSSTSNPPIIANNFISIAKNVQTALVSSGIHIGEANNCKVLQNSVNISVTNSTSGAFHFDGTVTGVSVKNNSFVNKSGYILYFGTNQPDSCDYNNLYNGISARFGNNNATAYANLSAWRTATLTDSHSVNSAPGYTSSTDLHLSTTSTGLFGKGKAAWGINKDIDGDFRTSTPDLGADEKPRANDAGIASIDSIAANICSGTLRIVATLGNYGSNSLSSVTVGWVVNGTNQGSASYTKTIASGSTVAGYYLGSYSFSSPGTYKIKVYTASPNGTTDDLSSNDTFYKTVTVLALPTFNITGKDSICPGLKSKWMDKGTSVSRIWKVASPGKQFTTTTDSLIFSYPSSGTYTIQLKGSNGVCYDSTTKSVTVLSVPTVTISGLKSICAGSTSVYKVAYGTGVVSGSRNAWTSTNSTINSTGADSAVVSFAKPGTATISNILTNPIGCSSGDTFTVTVNGKPTVGFSTSSTKKFCQLNTTDSLVSLSSAGLKYKWSVPSASTVTFNSNDTNSYIIASNATSGVYRIGLKITNLAGCSDTTSYAMTIVNRPAPVFGITYSGIGRKYIFNGITTYKSYLWSFGDTLKSTSTKQSDSFRYKTNGTFKVRYQVYNGTCWGQKDSSLVVNFTSVNDVVNGISAKIGLYPNPANANLTISINGNYQPKSISVMDINGKLMPIEMPALNKNSNSNSIMNINLNVASLPQGFYQILMTDGVNNSTLKFIKN